MEVETFGMTGRPYACKRCGYHTQAWVVVTGEASARSRRKRDLQDAVYGAKADADIVADRSLMFARCPGCQQRDPGARPFQVSRTLIAGGITAAIVALAILTRSASVMFFGSIKAGYWCIRLSRPWRGVARRVWFDPPAPEVSRGSS